MKDVYFNDYNKKGSSGSSKYNTSEIPITQREREFQDKINQERYEEIIKNQQKNADFYRKSQNAGKQDYNSGYNKTKINTDFYETNGKKKKPKKHRGCLTAFISVLLIVCILSGTAFAYVYSLCQKVKYEEIDTADNSSYIYDSHITNILLIGTDEDDPELSRSDTMMLVSVDRKNRKIKFTSFMRDMWVDIPRNGEAKLNAAFAYGGTSLLIETIEKNFEIQIDNYMLVNFNMFKQLIDGLGGVTVDITEAEADFINNTTHAKVTAGSNNLNGDYALIYCRIRKLDSDFMRTKRQRKVMSAILTQVKEEGILKAVSAAGNVLPLITTDIPPFKMTVLAFSAVTMLGYEFDQLRIPEDDMFSYETIEGQSALLPDIDANQKVIHQFIYG